METRNIRAYYINPDRFEERRAKMEYLNDHFDFVQRVAFNYATENRIETMTNAHLFALSQIEKDGIFPALLLEDDAAILNPIPKETTIPDCDLIYWGGSKYNCALKPDLFFHDFDENYKRVFYMLSAHAILIPHQKGLEKLRKAYENAIEKNIFNDVSLARTSFENVLLAPKGGMYFFQDDYTAEVTTMYI